MASERPENFKILPPLTGLKIALPLSLVSCPAEDPLSLVN
jgi:hypothetical protein